MKWIEINEIDNLGKKTKRFWVKSKEGGDTIGYIYWYGRWRKYCFFPNTDTVYEWICLYDIADFCKQETENYKFNWNRT